MQRQPSSKKEEGEESNSGNGQPKCEDRSSIGTESGRRWQFTSEFKTHKRAIEEVKFEIDGFPTAGLQYLLESSSEEMVGFMNSCHREGLFPDMILATRFAYFLESEGKLFTH